jgi:hypothetical protein
LILRLNNAKKLITLQFGPVFEYFPHFFQYFGFQVRLTNGLNPG